MATTKAQDAIRKSQMKALTKKLKDLETEYGAELEPSVIVGYVANYAIHVHENKEAKHNTDQQAKFLEDPLRDNQDKYAKVIAAALKLGESAKGALMLAGLNLQRDSQKIVPVDTGNLKAGAFTRYMGPQE